MNISVATPLNTDAGDQGTTLSLGVLNEQIYCLRFKLILDTNEYLSSFSFQIGTGNFPSPYHSGEHSLTQLNTLIANGGFRGIISTNEKQYLNANGTLNAEIVNANSFPISVSNQGTEENGKYYIISGTVNQHLFGGQTYYLWLYATNKISGGRGRLFSSELKTMWILETSPLGLAKIYVPKNTGSTEYEYKDALVYIHTNGAWQLVLPYLHTGGAWKNTC